MLARLIKGIVASLEQARHGRSQEESAGAERQAGALHEAGMRAMRAGRLQEAVGLLAQAVALDAGNAEYHRRHGDALRQLSRFEEAIPSYREAARLRPDFADPRNNLGVVLDAMGRRTEAIECFRAALALDPDFAEAHLNLGNALEELGQSEAAIASYREALRVKPDFALAYNNLAMLLTDMGRLDEARFCEERVLELSPNDGTRIKLATTIPVVPGSREDIARVRERLHESVTALLEKGVSLADPLAEVGQTNFYLAYQGLNDKDLQVLIAKLYEQACPALRYAAPHCTPGAPMAARRRVGFLSRYFFNHSVGTCFSRLIDRIAADGAFDVALITVGEVDDARLRETFPSVTTRLSVPFHLDLARRRIAELRLDVLVYTDIGMDPLTYFLAFSRLAPVQCVMLGHPVTSGIRNIDYFISSAKLEPEGARDHYSEELVLLDALPAWIARPVLPGAPKSRAALALPEAARLYVCPMMLQKLHPDFDHVIAGILRRDPRGEVVLFKDSRLQHRHQMVIDRFAATIPDVLERVRFLPWLPADDLMSVLMTADVVLDTPHFSAGTTAVLVLATGTPMITLPAAFARGRMTLAYYREIGVMDCVAGTPEEYVELALRMACNRDLRDAVRARILSSNGVLFDDPRLLSQLTEALSRLEPAKRRASGAEGPQ